MPSENQDRDYLFLPSMKVGIPVGHNAAAALVHLLRNNMGDIKLSLEDLRVGGCTLLVSSHIRIYPDWLDQEEQEDKMAHTKEFWDDYLQEQREKLGLNNPLTLAELKKLNEMIENGTIKFALEEAWSNEENDYNRWIEKEILGEEDDTYGA